MSEQRLVKAAMQGNTQAFITLVYRYQRVLVASACRIVRNADDAEELAQEALVGAYRQLPTLRDHGKFRPWLFGILRNTCVNYLQTRRAEELTLDCLHYLQADPEKLPLNNRENHAASVAAQGPEVADLLDQLPLPTARYWRCAI